MFRELFEKIFVRFVIVILYACDLYPEYVAIQQGHLLLGLKRLEMYRYGKYKPIRY